MTDREHCQITMTLDLDCPIDMSRSAQMAVVKAYFENMFKDLAASPQDIEGMGHGGVFITGGQLGAFRSEAQIYSDVPEGELSA